MVRKLASGRWQASYHNPELGRRVNAPTTWNTKADATAWLASEETKLRTGKTVVDPKRGQVRFKHYAADWLETRNLRPRTREIYESQLRVHILPTFGNVTLLGITPERVRQWNADLTKRQPAMAPKCYRQLRTMLSTAVDDGLIAENPCRVKGASQERTAERDIPTIAQVQALADGIQPRFRITVLLAAYCGLRKSEIFGLARRHLNLNTDSPTVTVERQRTELRGQGLVFADLKTDAAYRTVAIPISLADELQHHLDTYTGDEPDALLVTIESTADSPRSSTWQPIWRQAREAADAPNIRFHDLRHLAGTLTAIAGGTLKEIQSRLGHASPNAAMVYQHVAEGRDTHLAAKIDDIIGR